MTQDTIETIINAIIYRTRQGMNSAEAAMEVAELMNIRYGEIADIWFQYNTIAN
jgi:hypothetical protein